MRSLVIATWICAGIAAAEPPLRTLEPLEIDDPLLDEILRWQVGVERKYSKAHRTVSFDKWVEVHSPDVEKILPDFRIFQSTYSIALAPTAPPDIKAALGVRRPILFFDGDGVLVGDSAGFEEFVAAVAAEKIKMSSELAVRTFYKGFCAAVKFSAEGYSVTRPAVNRWRISKEVRGVVYHKDLFLDEALHLVSADSSWEKPVTKPGEQGGARQPATAVDSKSEGNENPEPESERRSR